MNYNKALKFTVIGLAAFVIILLSLTYFDHHRDRGIFSNFWTILSNIASDPEGPLSKGWLKVLGEGLYDPHSYSLEFSEGLAVKEQNNKYGFVNYWEDWVIEPIFDEARKFKDGKAAVIMHKKRGFIFIDKRGQLLPLK